MLCSETGFLSAVIFAPLAWGVLMSLLAFLSGGASGGAAATPTRLSGASADPEEVQGESRWDLPLLWLLLFLVGALLPPLLVILRGYGWVGSHAGGGVGTSFFWIPSLGVRYALGVDGLSLVLMALSCFLVPVAMVSGLREVGFRQKEYFFWCLVLQTALLGVFAAQDLFLFYCFWELTLVPSYFLIGIWGGEQRLAAATHFFIITLMASLPMLAGVFALLHEATLQFGHPSALFSDLVTLSWSDSTVALGLSLPQLLFLAFSLAFAVKLPLFPFHSWLPGAYSEAPMGGSILFAGLLSKMGGYGFLRVAFYLFPQVALQMRPGFITLAAVSVLYGGLLALQEVDLKKRMAYASLSHMGLIAVGLFSLQKIALVGAVFAMLSHGLVSAALFLILGVLAHVKPNPSSWLGCSRPQLDDFGGLARQLPAAAILTFVVMLADLAVPGLSGFVGEWLILLGAWEAHPWAVAAASLGVILGAWVMLNFFNQVFLGKPTLRLEALVHVNATSITSQSPPHHHHHYHPPSQQKSAPLLLGLVALIVAVILALGLAPKPLLEMIDPAVSPLMAPMNVPATRAAFNLMNEKGAHDARPTHPSR